MKRNLLISAVLLAGTGAALAQSSVTVYGRLNTSVERQKNFSSTEKDWVLANNGSRIGFKGVEDLGGGLKAGFVLEHRFNVNNGAATNSAFWGGAGTSEVNLGSAALGTIRLGHFTSESYFATSDVTDMLNHGTGTSSDALYKDLVFLTGPADSGQDNRVSYRAPEFAGLTVEGGASISNGNTAQRLYDFAANYTVGALGLGLGAQKIKNGDDQFAVRASYDFSPFVVTGYIQRYKDKANVITGVDEKQTIWRLSGMYTLGASEFHVAGGRAGDLGDIANTNAKQFTVGYNYNLSKRTKVFTYFNKVNIAGTSADPSTVAFGVRHNF